MTDRNTVVIRPVASRQVIEDAYSVDQFARLVHLVREKGPSTMTGLAKRKPA